MTIDVTKTHMKIFIGIVFFSLPLLFLVSGEVQRVT